MVKEMKRGKQRDRKKEHLTRVQRTFSTVLYALVFGSLCYPWMLIGDKRYSLAAFVLRLKKKRCGFLCGESGAIVGSGLRGRGEG